ncbi:MAG: golvesin C-terminal-like domain-containing protein [Ignavibacteriaceae bacterium]
MKSIFRFFYPILFVSAFFYSCSTSSLQREQPKIKPPIAVGERTNQVKKETKKKILPLEFPANVKVGSVIIDSLKKSVTINYSKELSFIPFREENVKEIYSGMKKNYGYQFNDYSFSIRTMGYLIEELIPNFFRSDSSKYDTSRMPPNEIRPKPVVENISEKFIPSNGLFDRNIVVWQSHGWYYNNSEDRWEWQRPRVFQSVEDKLPLSFVVPYLIPMLEKAGANVFDPRERDFQTNEVVVDNDSPSDIKSNPSAGPANMVGRQAGYYLEKPKWKTGKGKGFAFGKPPYKVDYNPFIHGTFRETNSNTQPTASISWIPQIPEEGFYAVYISYSASDKNVGDAHYTVYHEGIKTEFKINQQIGGSTWEYLGKFKFDKDYNPEKDKVVLTNQSADAEKIVTADAVRFGGGMGIIERGGSTSGRPKILEAARYYLQYLGMPDTLVYNLHDNKDDYTDDYMSRPEYVNYLYGAPFGPNKDRNVKGLGIPIDLSLAFHTDAGTSQSDTTIGTLAIYSTTDFDSQKIFPNGVSRLANRDLADIMQTQIVDDIRAKYDPIWNRRMLDDARYSEVVRPNVPSVLIELLAHQNFLDMKFAKDPEFRFDVARSMYKGILKFLSVQNHFKYVIEPLPINSFSAVFDNLGNVLLKWQPTKDTLEPTAIAEKYIVYTRINNGDFDNGILVDEPYAIIKKINERNIYSFKVTALNSGGESFPSEILSVCKMHGSKKPVLIINGFDRVSAPASVDEKNYSGFQNQIDGGVPDKYDLSFTGSQYNFDPSSEWKSNDEPGWGASSADYETKVIAGNTFDYPYVHGLSIKANGFSFVSSSEKAVIDGAVKMDKYKIVDLILGEQRKTHWQKSIEDSLHGIKFKTFPKKFQTLIKDYCDHGGNIFISGSYVASDLFEGKDVDSHDISFANKILKFTLDADHAAKTGEVYSVKESFLSKYFSLKFNQHLSSKTYDVWAPDAVGKFGGSSVILRYKENEFPAGVAFKKKYGAIVIGFPFETLETQEDRNELMKAILNFFGI